MHVEIIEADLDNPAHAQATVRLLDDYARHPMGRSRALESDVQQRLIPGLREQPGTIVLLALADAEPVGIAVLYVGFSSFNARRLINIHDLSVTESHRGRGIGRRLLEKIASKGRELGCCKVTMEVRTDNHPARELYQSEGFSAGDEPMEFWTKYL